VDHGLLHSAGFYLTTARGSNEVGVFRISGSGPATTLTTVAGSPFPTGGLGGASSVSVFDSTGSLVVTGNGDSIPDISVKKPKLRAAFCRRIVLICVDYSLQYTHNPTRSLPKKNLHAAFL
jgi:hypothetical protein